MVGASRRLAEIHRSCQTLAMSFYLYVLRCYDGHFYVGHTDDLERRVAAHNAGSYGGYTATRRPVTLVYSQDFPTRDEAFQAERRVKGWSRAKEPALIQGRFDKLPQLSSSRSRPPSHDGLPPPRPSTSSGRA